MQWSSWAASYTAVLVACIVMGAFVCLVATVQVFALHLAYDAPVKLFSLHQILLALFLPAPNA